MTSPFPSVASVAAAADAVAVASVSAAVVALASVALASVAVAAKAPASAKGAGLTPETLPRTPWSDVEAAAKGSTVTFAMWSGNQSINAWVDGFVAKAMKERHGVTVKRRPQKDPVEFVDRSLAEKKAGRAKGSVDLVWINGENFKLSKDAGLLWGSFAGALPSFGAFYDASSPDIAKDFGTPVEGHEAPYGKAQFTFTYDSAKVPSPPKTFKELGDWCAKNPGRFTYPAPPDFTGSAFVRQSAIHAAGGPDRYLAEGGAAALARELPGAMAKLAELRPCLWRKGATYPDSLARLNQLYSDGEVWMTMAYSPVEAENQIRKGLFPATSRTFVLEEGTLANTHFVSIPFNAPNVAGALVLANFLLSPEAQLSKLDPREWGDLPALDTARLDPKAREAFKAMDLGKATLPLADLAARRIPELPPAMLVAIEKAWTKAIPR